MTRSSKLLSIKLDLFTLTLAVDLAFLFVLSLDLFLSLDVLLMLNSIVDYLLNHFPLLKLSLFLSLLGFSSLWIDLTKCFEASYSVGISDPPFNIFAHSRQDLILVEFVQYIPFHSYLLVLEHFLHLVPKSKLLFGFSLPFP